MALGKAVFRPCLHWLMDLGASLQFLPIEIVATVSLCGGPFPKQSACLPRLMISGLFFFRVKQTRSVYVIKTTTYFRPIFSLSSHGS